jgi:arylformamidase
LEIFDISPEISEKTAVFPGDQAFERGVQLSFEKKDNLLLSWIKTSVHIGAHTDAPNHYHPSGEGMHTRSLENYLGPAQVIEVNIPRGQRILPKDIAHTEISATRVLFKTGSFPDPNKWNDDFNALSPELIHHLSTKGVILAGIDTPSIDPHDSKALESHKAVFQHNMAILEGIVLQEVLPGLYTLLALPLRLKNADASPVRAVLLKGSLPWKK